MHCDQHTIGTITIIMIIIINIITIGIITIIIIILNIITSVTIAIILPFSLHGRYIEDKVSAIDTRACLQGRITTYC